MKKTMIILICFISLILSNILIVYADDSDEGLKENNGLKNYSSVEFEHKVEISEEMINKIKGLSENMILDINDQLWTWLEYNMDKPKTLSEQALQEFIDYELNDDESTYNDIIKDIINSKGKETIQENFGNEKINKIWDFSDIVKDIYKEYNDSKKELKEDIDATHTTLTAIKQSATIYDTMINIFWSIVDYGNKENDSLLKIGSKVLSKSIGFGKDFINTDTYSKWSSEFNPLWLKVLDYVFDEIYENGHNIFYHGSIIETESKLNTIRDESIYYSIKEAFDINALKPNIYLYGFKNTEIEFKFKNEKLLIKTIPKYEDVWNIKVDKDGSLIINGKNKYSYLFYESQTLSTLFQKNQGFIIYNDKRSNQFKKILNDYGFNEQEIDDFICFWDKKLGNEDYIMFPQYTATVDLAMPIYLNRNVNSYYRIWFCFEKVKNNNYKVLQPNIQPIKHEGNTLIEWGGMIFE